MMRLSFPLGCGWRRLLAIGSPFTVGRLSANLFSMLFTTGITIAVSRASLLGTCAVHRFIHRAIVPPGISGSGSVLFPFSSILPKIILPLAVCSTLVTEISIVLPISLRA